MRKNNIAARATRPQVALRSRQSAPNRATFRAARQSQKSPATTAASRFLRKQTQPSVNHPHNATNARFCYNITKISNPEPK